MANSFTLGFTSHNTQLAVNLEPQLSVHEKPVADISDTPPLTLPANSQLHVVINPAAGANKASEFADTVLIPILNALKNETDVLNVYHTRENRDGVRIGEVIKSSVQSSDPRQTAHTIFCLAGDSTTYELLNGLGINITGDKHGIPPIVNIVILPFGTSNAFYYSIFPPDSPTDLPQPLQSLKSTIAFLKSTSPCAQNCPVSLAAVNVVDSSRPPSVVHVVASTALHASILYDADEERRNDPSSSGDIDRFKRAADRNLGRQYPGTLILEGSNICRYSIAEKSFTPVEENKVEVPGPFAYFAGCLIDRFEPTFIVAPLKKFDVQLQDQIQKKGRQEHDKQTEPASIDLIFFRPNTHAPANTFNNPEALETWQREMLSKLAGAMYDGGKHIDMSDDGGPLMEYWRCSSFKWIPSLAQDNKINDDIRNQIACLDGDIFNLKNQSLHVQSFSSTDQNCNIRIQTWRCV